MHLNFAFREPLVPDGELPDTELVPGPRRRAPVGDAAADAARGRRRGCWKGSTDELTARPNAIVVAGRSERDPRLAASLAAFAERAGFPLLAEPLSGARRGPAAIAHYDALLRDEAWPHTCRTSCCASATCRPPSRCARGWRGSTRCR